MKNECPIVKDLMPLYIDGAVSEESRVFMDEHISSCPGCAQVYGEMRAELRLRDDQQEKLDQAELERAALRVRKRRMRRRLVLSLVCLALGAALCLTGISWYGDYYYSYDQIMTTQDYTVQLYRSTNRLGIVLFELEQDTLECLPEVTYTTQRGGTVQVNLKLTTTRKPYHMEPQEVIRAKEERTLRIGEWTAGVWYAEGRPGSSVVVKYGDGEQVIYEQGGNVSFCSTEMRRYYELLDSDARSEGMDMQTYLKEMLLLRDQVPEWQLD